MTHYETIRQGQGAVYECEYYGRRSRATRLSIFAVEGSDGKLYATPEIALRASYYHDHGAYSQLPAVISYRTLQPEARS